MTTEKVEGSFSKGGQITLTEVMPPSSHYRHFLNCPKLDESLKKMKEHIHLPSNIILKFEPNLFQI
jgi:hypothetical protein